MSRYIDVDILDRLTDGFTPLRTGGYDYDCGYSDCISMLKSAANIYSTADVAEVKHAHWTDAVSDCWHCSECLHPILLNGGEEYVFSNYCPNCGARMDGGEE